MFLDNLFLNTLLCSYGFSLSMNHLQIKQQYVVFYNILSSLLEMFLFKLLIFASFLSDVRVCSYWFRGINLKIFDQMHFSISVGCDDQEYVWFESSFRHCFGLNTLCRFFSYASLCQYWFHKFNSLTKNGNKNQWKVVFEWKKLKSKLILMNTPTYEHESDHQV